MQVDRQFFALSLGVTVLFVLYTLYWNRFFARVVCLLLRYATWDNNAPGSFWLDAGTVSYTSLYNKKT
jgi:hypothetical protein